MLEELRGVKRGVRKEKGRFLVRNIKEGWEKRGVSI